MVAAWVRDGWNVEKQISAALKNRENSIRYPTLCGYKRAKADLYLPLLTMRFVGLGLPPHLTTSYPYYNSVKAYASKRKYTLCVQSSTGILSIFLTHIDVVNATSNYLTDYVFNILNLSQQRLY